VSLVWNDAMSPIPGMAVNAAGAQQPFYLPYSGLNAGTRLDLLHLLKNWFWEYVLKVD
jgi:hypothetical protein